MKIGASIMLSYDGTYHDFLNYAVSMKFDWVEFKYDPPFMLDRHLSKVSREQIRQIAKENDIGLSCMPRITRRIWAASILTFIEAVSKAAWKQCTSRPISDVPTSPSIAAI